MKKTIQSLRSLEFRPDRKIVAEEIRERELTDNEKRFISKLTEIVHENLGNENFGVNDLASVYGLSLYSLSRKLNAVRRIKVNRFIREIRLQKALEILSTGAMSASEVSYSVGFSSPAYFTKCFREYFGYTPGEFNKNNGAGTANGPAESGQSREIRENRIKMFRLNVHQLFFLGMVAVFCLLLLAGRVFKTVGSDELTSFNGKVPVVVMPFRNFTSDTSLNIWEITFQQGVISSLSQNSQDLMIRQQESVNSLLHSGGITRNAFISPAIAGRISKKLEAPLFIMGDMVRTSGKIRIETQIIKTSNKSVLRSFIIERPSDGINFFSIIDTLSLDIRNFLLISRLISGKPDIRPFQVTTGSPEALRYWILGTESRGKPEFKDAITWFSKALAIDSNFTHASFGLENAYACAGFEDQSKEMLLKNYLNRSRMNPVDQVYASWCYACSFESPEIAIGYLRQLEQMDDQWPKPPYLQGIMYNWIGQYHNAIPKFERSFELCRKWGKEYMKNNSAWEGLGKAYHMTGQFRKEKRLYRQCRKYMPDEPLVMARMALLSYTEKDTVRAEKIIEKFREVLLRKGFSESYVAKRLGEVYAEAGLTDKSEVFYRKALAADPYDYTTLTSVVNFFFNHNRHLDEANVILDKAMNLATNRCKTYELLDLRGKCLLRQGKNSEALSVLENAWNTTPFRLYYLYADLQQARKSMLVSSTR